MKDHFNVLHYIDSLRSGGKERQLIELLKGLSNTVGVSSSVVIMSDVIHYSDFFDIDIETKSIIRNYTYDPMVITKFMNVCKQWKPDIIHTWNSMCSVYAIPAVLKFPVVYVKGDIRDAPSRCITKKAWYRHSLAAPFADAILSNSIAGIQAYGVRSAKGHVIHNGFDFNRIQNLTEEHEIRDKFNIKTKYVVGMVASFSQNKDYTTFIQAAIHILQQRNDVTFIAVGGGRYFEECKRSVPKSLSEKILFLGKLERNVESIINVFTIGVLATFTEGISNSIMEYMALAKPVVATDCAGTREIILDNESGLLVRQRDSVEMADKIILLLDSPAKMQQFGNKGLQRIKDDFSLTKMTSITLQLYHNLLKQREKIV